MKILCYYKLIKPSMSVPLRTRRFQLIRGRGFFYETQK